MTIGNHEIDCGIAHLLFLEKCAKFPIINANMHITTNNARLFKSHHVIEMDGMKILFIGILTETVLSMAKKEALVGGFVDVADAATGVERICNAYNSLDIDCTVLLTHIGFEEDKQLALSAGSMTLAESSSPKKSAAPSASAKETRHRQH